MRGVTWPAGRRSRGWPPRAGRWTSRPTRLTVQLQQESSPEFQERQARARLTYVLPGDRLVMVVDGKAVPGAAAASSSAPPKRGEAPWYVGLLESVSTADG